MNLTDAQKDGIEAARSLFASGDDNTAKYRGYYKKVFGRDTKLTDEQIITMVGMSEDDDDPEGWAKTMSHIEELPAQHKQVAE